MDLPELEWEIVDCIHLPGGRNQCQALLVKGLNVTSGVMHCEGRLDDRL